MFTGLRQPPACALCPVVGPPMRPTSCGRWCHIICAQWLEETVIVKGMVYGLENINKVPLHEALWTSHITLQHASGWDVDGNCCVCVTSC